MIALEVAVTAWTGSSGAVHLPTDKAQESGAMKAFPFSISKFFSHHYDKSMLRLNHTETHFDTDLLWKRDDIRENIASIVVDDKLGTVSTFTVSGSRGKANFGTSDPAGVHEEFERQLANGTSFLLSFEKVSPKHQPMKQLADGLFNLTGIPASVHLYCSAPGAQVLKPHTDPYDVLVWQLVGTKRWRACVPRAELGAAAFGKNETLSDAKRCLLQELSKENIEGCTTYTVDDAASLECEDFVMAPGDFLYMPKGVVHYANTDDGESFHLTIGLHRVNMQWIDVFHALLRRHAAATSASAAAGSLSLEHSLMEIYAGTAAGIHLHEAVPGWLLHCYRPWFDAEADGEHDCASLDDEIRRVYLLHLGLFGDWLVERRRAPWELAEFTAKASQQVGQPVDLRHVAAIAWWGGDLSFLSSLAEDEAALWEQMRAVGQVVTYHESSTRGWRPRVKTRSRSLRKHGDRPRDGPTLCDEMSGWNTECEGSGPDVCEAFAFTKKAAPPPPAPRPVAGLDFLPPPPPPPAQKQKGGQSQSCAAFCAEKGMHCEASWDNEKSDSCARMQPKNGKTGCNVPRGDQICRCTRDCSDRGPWECAEEGCPEPLVSCTLLVEHGACGNDFGMIWRKPPADVLGQTVTQGCPQSCGACPKR